MAGGKTFTRKTFRKKRFMKRFKRRPNIQSIRFPNVGNMTLRQAAYGAAKGVGMLKGIINSERKRFDFELNAYSVTNISSFVQLSDIQEGADYNQRNGLSVLAKALDVTYILQMNTAATINKVRVLVFVDTQNQGVDPSVTDLLSGTTSLVAHLDPANTQRFTVLFDDMIGLNINGNAIVQKKHHIPLNFHLRWTSTTGSSFNKNAIYAFLLSDTLSNPPVINWQSRINYYDN